LGWSFTNSASGAQRHHGEAGMGRVAALVAAMRFGACLGLLHGVHGHDAVADRKLVPDRQIHQAARALAADIVVVRGLAADHAAQSQEAVVAAGGERDRAGNLERARHDHALRGGAILADLGLGTGDQRVGDLGVIARFDDQDARALTPSTGGASSGFRSVCSCSGTATSGASSRAGVQPA
jgi:hypothetical protein